MEQASVKVRVRGGFRDGTVLPLIGRRNLASEFQRERATFALGRFAERNFAIKSFGQTLG